MEKNNKINQRNHPELFGEIAKDIQTVCWDQKSNKLQS